MSRYVNLFLYIVDEDVQITDILHAGSWKVAGSRSDEPIFLSTYLIVPAALGPGVYSAFNRN
jgi:hypothetical protein